MKVTSWNIDKSKLDKVTVDKTKLAFQIAKRNWDFIAAEQFPSLGDLAAIERYIATGSFEEAHSINNFEVFERYGIEIDKCLTKLFGAYTDATRIQIVDTDRWSWHICKATPDKAGYISNSTEIIDFQRIINKDGQTMMIVGYSARENILFIRTLFRTRRSEATHRMDLG